MPDTPAPSPGALPPARSREAQWRMWAAFVVTLAASQLIFGFGLKPSAWKVCAAANAGVAEGVAWTQGRLTLPAGPEPAHDRMHDTAYSDGRILNVYPPLVPLLTVVLVPLAWLAGGAADCWPSALQPLLIFWTLPIVGFIVFRRLAADSIIGAILTLTWIGGTALLPNLQLARGGNLGAMNHVLSQVGLLILAADLLGRQRIWPAVIGLLIAVWSRQITCLYALPLICVAFQRRRLPACFAGLLLIAAPLLALNQLKFGNPFDFGYRNIYVNRDDFIAARAHEHGLFSSAFLAHNFWYMHAALPHVSAEGNTVRFVPSDHGASIWFTTPILLFLLIDVRRWWTDPTRRALMLTTLLVMLGLLAYHNCGFVQIGYNRFALDFIPVWLAVIAPFTRPGWRTTFTLVAAAWSIYYFQTAVRVI